MSSLWVEKRKTDNIWLYEYVGKLKGIGNHGEVKRNEMNINNISDLQKYVQPYGFPKLPIRGFGQIYEHGMEALPRKPTPPIKDHKKAKKYVFIEIWRETDGEVKVVFLHVKILLYH